MRYYLKQRSEVMITSMFGERVVHPEFVSTTCAECGEPGYTNGDTIEHAKEHGHDLVHKDCTDDRRVRWD